MTIKNALVILVLAALAAPPAQAQDKVGTTAAAFLGVGIGARGTAMGGAQVAQAQGPSALYWNPSAVAAMPSSGAEFTNANWFVDSRFQHLGLVVNTGNLGHFGVSVMALNYGEIEVTTVTRPDGTGERFTPLDLAVGVSYARNLTDRFALGATVKYVSQQIWNSSATGAALDLGVTYTTPFRGLRIGMAMTNFGTNMQMTGRDLRQAIDPAPNQQGNNPYLPGYLETDSWAMPLMFRVGVSMDAYTGPMGRLTLSTDGQAPADNAQSASFGAEYAFRDLFFVRGGYREAFSSVAEDGGWTFGFGLRYAINPRLAGYFDYAFQEYRPFGTPQMFSLGVTF
jgi:hypothetical protein